MTESFRVRILDALELGPMTAANVSLLLGGNYHTARKLLRRLEKRGIVEQVGTLLKEGPGVKPKVWAIKGSVAAKRHPLNVREGWV